MTPRRSRRFFSPEKKLGRIDDFFNNESRHRKKFPARWC